MISMRRGPKDDYYILVVLWTGLVFRQSSQVLMEADQGDLESLASLNWIGHTGTADQKPSSLDTGEIL